MQDMVGGDNNRTPVKFQGYDNLVFVGGINGYQMLYSPVIFLATAGFSASLTTTAYSGALMRMFSMVEFWILARIFEQDN